MPRKISLQGLSKSRLAGNFSGRSARSGFESCCADRAPACSAAGGASLYRGLFRSLLQALCLTAAVVSVPAADAQLVVRRVPGKLGDARSSWTESPQPKTRLEPSATASQTSTAAPLSSFAPATAPRSEFALSDVPAGRLEATRRLLGEFKARPDAAGAIVVDLPGDVLFDFDKHDLRADALPVLDRLAELLAGFPARGVAVNGYTDSKGDDAYNDALSRRRAESVHRYLVERDGSKTRTYDVSGFGEHRPVAPNQRADGSDDPEGRQRNRRVEIVLRPVQS